MESHTPGVSWPPWIIFPVLTVWTLEVSNKRDLQSMFIKCSVWLSPDCLWVNSEVSVLDAFQVMEPLENLIKLGVLFSHKETMDTPKWRYFQVLKRPICRPQIRKIKNSYFNLFFFFFLCIWSVGGWKYVGIVYSRGSQSWMCARSIWRTW